MVSDLEALKALSLVALTDLSKRVPLLFIHALKDLQEEVLAKAALLYFYGRVGSILLNGLTQEECAENNVDYPGKEAWEKILVGNGVPKKAILYIPPAHHTFAEAEAAQKFCLENNINSLGVMGVPYHILRCVLTQLGAMKKQETILRIYPVTVDCTDWQKKVTRKILQGGTFTKTRLDIWAEEMDRIERYTLKGDCVPLSAMIDFFKKQGAS